MLTWVIAGFLGWLGGVITLLLYIRGRLLERWWIGGQNVKEGYEVLLRKGKQTRVIYRVLFDRHSSPNPDSSFQDQLAQARADAQEHADALNAHEHIVRDKNRRAGLPGGL